MAIEAVLVGTGATSTSSVTTAGGTTTTGSTFVISASFDPGANISSVTDSKGNTYTQVVTPQTTSSGSKLAMYYCANGTGGASHTATVNYSATAYSVVYLVEVTGAASASFDVTAKTVDTSSPFTVSTGTLAQADEVVITAVANDDGSSVNYTSSNTTIIGENNDTANYWTGAISKQVVASTSSFTPSFTLSAGTNLALITATFKAAGGGAFTLTADVGSYTVTGNAASLIAPKTLTAAAGSYVITGVAAATKYNRLVNAAVGNYTITGSDALADYVITAATGSYNITGVASALLQGRRLTADVGSYTITGVDAAFITGIRLVAESGSYTVTGVANNLLYNRLITANTASYTISGQDATLSKSGGSTSIVAESGTYNISGIAAGLLKGYVVTGQNGSYTVTGVAAGTRYNRSLSANSGAYTISGQDVSFITSAAQITIRAGSWIRYRAI